MAQVLYITGHSMTLYHVHRKAAEALGRFACNDSGYRELVQQLLIGGDLQPIAILADLIEEEFREEALPHTIGRDRISLLDRHAGKMFRATPFRFFRVVGRQKEGRRDDLVLFSALTNRDNIEPLLTTLEEAGIPVKGIYSLPVITHRLLKPLGNKAENVLLVTEQPDGGLRETFVRDGQVHFSRLAPISDGSPDDFCGIVTAEVNKTRRYLNSLRLLPPNQSLDVYALCDSQRVEALQNMTSEEGDIRIHAVNLSHVASVVGFAGHDDIQFSDALFCYLLKKKFTANHYAPPKRLRQWQTYKARFGLRAATWLLAVSSATMAGMNVVDGLLMERESRQLVQVTSQVDHNYQQATQELPLQPREAIAMREALQLADRLDAYPVDLNRLYTLLGNGFSAQPNFAMDRLSWFVADNPDAMTPTEMRPSGSLVAITAEPFLVTTVRGHLRRFNGSYRQAHEQIDQLVDWLSEQPRVRSAEVTSRPLNTRTDSNLQGSVESEGEREIARFELRIIMELGHEPV